MNSPFTIVLFSLSILSIRPLIVILHELGHAIPAMIFTKEKVTVYIGSYGNPEKSFNFKIGLLEMCFSYEKFYWRNGICFVTGTMSVSQKLIQIISGPLCCFIIALALYCSMPEYGSYNSYEYVMFIKFFLGISIFDLFFNLVPDSKPIELANGNTTYNDGHSIKILLMQQDLNPKLEKARQLYCAKDFHNAIPLLDYLLKKIPADILYRLNIDANINIENYEKAKILSDEFIRQFELNSNDYAAAGIANSFLGFYEEAIEHYDKSLELNGNNVFALNNKGDALNSLERYNEAIPFFDKAIELSDRFTFAYNNRGFSKIKIGKMDEALLDIQKALTIKENPLSYRNLGIYNFDIGELNKAINFFLKAKQLDPHTPMIDELIRKAQSA